MATCETPDSSHLDRVVYLFGYPIAHSLSPLMHQTVYDDLKRNWSMLLFESTDISHFLSVTKDSKFQGSAVTMPHKVSILPYLDELTEEGREVGACNTIFLRERDGKRLLCGTNTDVVGIKEAFYQNVSDPDTCFHNRPALVVGGGGAARSAVYALHKYMKADPIYIVNRDAAEVEAVMASCASFKANLVHVVSEAQAEELEGCGAVVACVPDVAPVTPAEWTARHIIDIFLAKSHKGAWLEMAYHPRVYTTLAGLADRAGWQLILGTEAMIWQGFEQVRYWTGLPLNQLPVQKVQKVIAEALEKSAH